jgi:hypothetical protein
MTHVSNFIDDLGLIVPMTNFVLVAVSVNYLVSYFGG